MVRNAHGALFQLHQVTETHDAWHNQRSDTVLLPVEAEVHREGPPRSDGQAKAVLYGLYPSVPPAPGWRPVLKSDHAAPARLRGAYTSVFAGLSPEVTLENSGTHVAPWGRFWKLSREMQDAARPKPQGGSGIASEFWEWCEAQWKKPYW